MTPPDLDHWLFHQALPRWSTSGFDQKHGGFFDALRFDGSPVETLPKRMRVQARQAFSFCFAAKHGWAGDALSLADRTFEFLFANYWHDEGGFIFTVARDGTPHDTRRDSYEQAFALLALAAAYELKADTQYLDWTAQILGFLDELADSTFGGFQESASGGLPRRQNPHMHLLEAFLALYEATGDKAYLARAEKIFTLFQTSFFDATSGTLGEYFDENWQPAQNHLGETVEPGHHFEWVWLLEKLQRHTDAPVSEAQDALMDFATSHGVDGATHLVFDELSRNGQIRLDTKRLWPQTEHIKALMSFYRRTQDKAYLHKAGDVADALNRHYFDVGSGLWRDKLEADNSSGDEMSPASSLYHIILALIDMKQT